MKLLKERLKFYFKNPLFYIAAILFTVFININFFIRQQFFSTSGTTDLVFLFSSVPYISILVIPAICFKLSFSIYDDFVPLGHIKKILVNFCCILILYLLLIILLIPSCILINCFGQIDFGQLISSLIALVFYGAAAISLTLFIYQCCSNSVTALIISAVILAVINSAHLFTVYINLPDVFSSFVKHISFAWHFDAAGKGIIDTRDLIFLAAAALLFTSLNDLILLIKKGKSFRIHEKINYGLLIIISLLGMLNSSRYFVKFDLSKGKTYSISAYTKSLAEKIDSNLKITYYRSGNLSKLYPQVRDVTDFLTVFKSQNKNISLSIKNPDKDDSIKNLLSSYGIQSNQIQSVKNNSREYVDVYSAIVLEYEGNTEVIPFLLNAETLEYDLDGRIKFLLSGQFRIVNIIIGNGLSYNSESGYSYLIPWLNSQGFVCIPHFVDDPTFEMNLENTSGPLLILGDGEVGIDKAVAIEKYILEEKGKAFIAVSPYWVDINNDWGLKANSKTNIVEMLENWGVTFTNRIAGDISCASISMISDSQEDALYGNNSYNTIINYPLWINLLNQKNCTKGITLFWPVCLEVTENAEGFLYTTDKAFSYETVKNSSGSLIETNPFVLENSSISNLQKGQQIVGAKITGPLKGLYNLNSCDDSEIVVISDPYFVNTLTNGYNGGDFKNFDFLTDQLLRLNNEIELAQLHSKVARDTSLYKIYDYDQFSALQKTVYIVVFGAIPSGLILILSIFLIMNRRRYRNEKK